MKTKAIILLTVPHIHIHSLTFTLHTILTRLYYSIVFMIITLLFQKTLAKANNLIIHYKPLSTFSNVPLTL